MKNISPNGKTTWVKHTSTAIDLFEKKSNRKIVIVFGLVDVRNKLKDQNFFWVDNQNQMQKQFLGKTQSINILRYGLRIVS